MAQQQFPPVLLPCILHLLVIAICAFSVPSILVDPFLLASLA
jgi:hypothetical protein